MCCSVLAEECNGLLFSYVGIRPSAMLRVTASMSGSSVLPSSIQN